MTGNMQVLNELNSLQFLKMLQQTDAQVAKETRFIWKSKYFESWQAILSAWSAINRLIYYDIYVGNKHVVNYYNACTHSHTLKSPSDKQTVYIIAPNLAPYAVYR